MPKSHEQYSTPERQSPQIEIDFGHFKSSMNWSNTLLYTFEEGDGGYDHARHTTSDGMTVFFVPPENMIEQLVNGRFPQRHDPVVDELTLKWKDSLLADQLDVFMSQANTEESLNEDGPSA